MSHNKYAGTERVHIEDIGNDVAFIKRKVLKIDWFTTGFLTGVKWMFIIIVTMILLYCAVKGLGTTTTTLPL